MTIFAIQSHFGPSLVTGSLSHPFFTSFPLSQFPLLFWMPTVFTPLDSSVQKIATLCLSNLSEYQTFHITSKVIQLPMLSTQVHCPLYLSVHLPRIFGLSPRACWSLVPGCAHPRRVPPVSRCAWPSLGSSMG